MSIADCLPPTSSVAAGHHLLNIEPLLAVIAAGLLIGFVYCLVNVRVSEPSVFGLIGLAVLLFGHITAPVPVRRRTLLGLPCDTLEEEWYGSATPDGARALYPVRLLLRNSVSRWMTRYLWSGFGFGRRPSQPHGT